jgi:pimeloyl-ACP methyl ester carboxylesterase
MPPEVRYAQSGEYNIAYQVIGDGSIDLVVNHGWVSNLDSFWEQPLWVHFAQRLASFSRVILFDKRGTGLSDRVPVHDLPTLEERMDDVRAVMDAVGSEKAALYGYSEGGAMCALFAATYPDRATALVMDGAYARRTAAPDYPWGITHRQAEAVLEEMRTHWGQGSGLAARAPSREHDEQFRIWFASWQRQAASPAAVMAIVRMTFEIDIRRILPTIRVPTLILHRPNETNVPVEHSRHLAEHIPGAKYVELPGIDHLPYVGEADATLDEIEEFLTGVRHTPEPDRVLATVMFTDIVGSTQQAIAVGDRRWLDTLARHDAVVRQELVRHRGREVKTTGDGFLATFDGPARAVRCASAIVQAVRPLGLEVRAGVHTGECELVGDDVGGIAVHIGQRVSALAGPGEVLASSTVRDLVAGSGLTFESRGEHLLRGLPDEWRIYAVVGA